MTISDRGLVVVLRFNQLHGSVMYLEGSRNAEDISRLQNNLPSLNNLLSGNLNSDWFEKLKSVATRSNGVVHEITLHRKCLDVVMIKYKVQHTCQAKASIHHHVRNLCHN